MRTISYSRHRFPPHIIRHAVWLYARFTLSYRDVEDLLAARGLDISYETVRRWFLKFGPAVAHNLRRMRPTPSAESAMACAKTFAREQGNELPFTDKRIHKSLQEAGQLKTSEVDRNTVRKTLDGRRRYVLHLSAKTVLGIEPPSNEVPQKPVTQVDEDIPF